MANISIRKNSGENEDFNFEKLLASIGKTGVPLKEAVEITKDIQVWAESSDNNSISSTQIRDKVIESLSVDYPAEADMYKTYKK